MITGRIENEPDSVYHGPSDKPKFGSSAIKLWIQDQEQFYRTYITKEICIETPSSAVFDIGHAVEEPVLENRDRRFDSGFKTQCANLKLLKKTHPEKIVLTTSDYELSSNLIGACLADDRLRAFADAGTPQVTYRFDAGPFYLQARIDLEVDPANATDDELGTGGELAKLLIDLKTTKTLYGKNSFARSGQRTPLLYPVQEAYYREVVWLVTGIGVELLPFWFVAVSKDELKTEWRRFADPAHKARNRVLSSISELKHRFESGSWDEFEGNVRTTFVPDNYLEWVGE